jgi:hypothetical protein
VRFCSIFGFDLTWVGFLYIIELKDKKVDDV